MARPTHCYWCGRETRHVAPVDGKLPPDAATRDHIYPKRIRNRMSYVEVMRLSKTVLACYECNNARGSKSVEVWIAEMQDWRDRELAERLASAFNSQRML